MEFTLDVILKLSRPIEEDLTQYVESSKEVLEKGAPEGEEAVIENWEHEKDEIRMTISSGRFVRPHNAVFRIKNHLGKEMGPKLKAGVREISGVRYSISFSLEEQPDEKIEVPFAESIEFHDNDCFIEIDPDEMNEEFLKKNYVDRILNLVQEKIDDLQYEGKAEHHEVIWESEKKEHAWNKDPTQEMADRNWIVHQGRGRWIFGPIPTKVIRTMEEIVEEELLNPLEAKEMILPKAVSWDTWKRSGHAKSLYKEMYYLCAPKTRDPKFWEEIEDLYKVTGKVPLEKIKKKIDLPLGGVSYAQCPPMWPFMENRTLDLNQMPLVFFDRSGPSMRYESGGIHGIERVDEFHRIEVVWMGTRKQVKELHEEIIEKYKHIFEDILELEWRMAWVTPWFMAQEGLKGLADDKMEIGTVDFEAYLPYKGTREDSEWLEFQNASNNGDKYPKGFSVKLSGGKQLYSGCTGIGLERWLATFIAQKGLDPENWPPKFKEKIGDLPEELRIL